MLHAAFALLTDIVWQFMAITQISLRFTKQIMGCSTICFERIKPKMRTEGWTSWRFRLHNLGMAQNYKTLKPLRK